MYTPSAVTKQVEINAAIENVLRSIGPDVVRIRYDIGEDWSGQWAIFFRVVLSDDENPTSLEKELIDVTTSFEQLQKDRQRADYDSGWKLVETDVRNFVRLSEHVFAKWRKIKDEDIARHNLLSMFGAKWD